MYLGDGDDTTVLDDNFQDSATIDSHGYMDAVISFPRCSIIYNRNLE